MDLSEFPDELCTLLMQGMNDGIQTAVQRLLFAASKAKQGCSCKIYSSQDIAGILEVLAYEIDASVVCWEDTAEAHALANGIVDAASKQKMKRAAKEANKDRRHIVPGDPWKEIMGFSPKDCPSEEEIKQAFRTRAKALHPDNPDVDSSELFVELKNAHDQALLELHGPKKPEAAPKVVHSGEAQTAGCPSCGKALGIDVESKE